MRTTIKQWKFRVDRVVEINNSLKKSDRKEKNKSWITTTNSKNLKYDACRPTHQYNQSVGTFQNPTQSNSHINLKNDQLYSTVTRHNKSSNNPTAGNTNVKSHLAKKMIKNYVKTQRDKNKMSLKQEFEKNRNQSNEKKLKTYRKGVCTK